VKVANIPEKAAVFTHTYINPTTIINALDIYLSSLQSKEKLIKAVNQTETTAQKYELQSNRPMGLLQTSHQEEIPCLDE